MHLLLVDNSPESARRIHSEFLDYRGLNWSLSHCTDYRQAVELLDQDSFQALLYRTDAAFDEATMELQELLRGANCPPLVAVTSQLNQREQLSFIDDGSEDCCGRAQSNGQSIMRSLRMAEARKATFNEQLNEVAEDILPGFSLSEFLSSPANAVGQASGATSLDRDLNVAHLTYATPLIDQLPGEGDLPALTRFDNLDRLLAQLEQGVEKFDALIVEQSAFEQASEMETAKLAHYLSVLPGLVLTHEQSDYAALSYLEKGYSDCVVSDQSSLNQIEMTIRKAVIRRRRALLASLSEPQVGPTTNDRRAELRTASIRRRHVRFQCQAKVVAIPVLPNHAPDSAAVYDATATDVSLGGINLTLPSVGLLPRRNWIVGIEQENGHTGYVSAYLRRTNYGSDRVNVGLLFESPENDFLSVRNLRPAVDTATGRFASKLSPTALDQWVELGVLKKRLVRRTRCCPECDAVCSVGTGCCMCGSYDLNYHDLIHHFACAHVNHVVNFEHEDSIQCPKCLGDHLVAGADFEVIRSRYDCAACNYQGDATASVGCCLNCDLRFPLELAPESEVYAYDVERMDLLALVDSARRAAVADPATDRV